MNKYLTFFALLVLSINKQIAALDPNHFTVTRITAPYFIDDHNGNNLVKNAYVGFEIKNNSNSGTTYSRLKFSISDITSSIPGTNYTVIGPSSGTILVGKLAPGQSKVCYFYINYPTGGEPVATFTTVLRDSTANSKTSTFNIFNRPSISANAGGLSRQSVLNQDILGGFFTNDITYTVGNVRNGDEVDFQATIAQGFNPTELQLISTQVIASSIPNINIGATDSLYFITGQGRTGDSVKIRWKFRITAPSFKAYMLPYSGATSGSTNYKFQVDASLGNVGDSFVVASPPGALSITKKSDKRNYTVCDTAKFTLTLKNTSGFGITIDSILDQLPANFSYIELVNTSQIQVSNCTNYPENGLTGSINFIGGVDSENGTSFFVPSNDSLVLVYTAKAPCSPQADQSTQVSGYIGSTKFDIDSNTVKVLPVLPNVPIALSDSFLTTVDVPISGNLASNDTLSIDGGNVWSLLTAPTNGLVSVLPNGTFTYTPSPDFNGVDTFYYRIVDANGDADTAMVIIHITTTTPINDIKLIAGIVNSQTIQLIWNVSCETDIKEYQIEKSQDGFLFYKFAQRNPSSTCLIKKYQESDLLKKGSQYVYYRLKIIKTNGTCFYSNTSRVNIPTKSTTTVFPIPFNDDLNIGLEVTDKKNAEIRLYQTSGKMILNRQFVIQTGINVLRLDNLGEIPRGAYILKILLNGQQVDSKMIIK